VYLFEYCLVFCKIHEDTDKPHSFMHAIKVIFYCRYFLVAVKFLTLSFDWLTLCNAFTVKFYFSKMFFALKYYFSKLVVNG